MFREAPSGPRFLTPARWIEGAGSGDDDVDRDQAEERDQPRPEGEPDRREQRPREDALSRTTF